MKISKGDRENIELVDASVEKVENGWRVKLRKKWWNTYYKMTERETQEFVFEQAPEEPDAKLIDRVRAFLGKSMVQ